MSTSLANAIERIYNAVLVMLNATAQDPIEYRFWMSVQAHLEDMIEKKEDNFNGR